MDSEICSLNVSGCDDPRFKYSEMTVEAVSTRDGGSGVDIDDIFEYIKVENRYKILDGTASKEVTNLQLTLNPKDSTGPQNLPISSLVEDFYKILNGAATMEATNPTQISKPEDSTKSQDQSSTSLVPEDKLKKYADTVAETIALAENLEFQGKKLSELADKFDHLAEESHINVLLAKEFYKQCKEGKPIPLVNFTEDVFKDWLVKIDI